MAIWRSCIAKYLLAIWHYFIAKCTRAIWQHHITKNTLAILGTSYRLNINDRVSNFYKARGSKLCFLKCFSYFSCYFLILVFLQKLYSLISLCLSRLHKNLNSRPISHTFGTPSRYVVHVPPCFWHRMHGFLKARRSWEPGSRLTTGDLSPFRLLLKVSGANVRWENANHTFLTHKNPWTDTFLHDISPAKLRSTAWVRTPKGISKLVNKVDCWVPHALLKAIVRAFLATKSFAEGSSTYPCHVACVSKSVSRDVISLSDCCPQWHRSAMDVTRNSRGQSLSIPFMRFSGFSGA
jgi:hypothetical protein